MHLSELLWYKLRGFGYKIVNATHIMPMTFGLFAHFCVIWSFLALAHCLADSKYRLLFFLIFRTEYTNCVLSVTAWVLHMPFRSLTRTTKAKLFCPREAARAVPVFLRGVAHL